MKLFKVVLVVSLIISIGAEVTFAKSNTPTQKELKRYKPLKVNEGRSLKSLETSKLSDVHLVKPVKYFDIKFYKARHKVLTSKLYTGGWSFDMNAYHEIMDNRGNMLLEKEISDREYSGNKCYDF